MVKNGFHPAISDGASAEAVLTFSLPWLQLVPYSGVVKLDLGLFHFISFFILIYLYTNLPSTKSYVIRRKSY